MREALEKLGKSLYVIKENHSYRKFSYFTFVTSRKHINYT